MASTSSSEGSQACIAPSPLPVQVIQKLQAILETLIANERLEKCISIYVEVRGLIVRSSLQALNLDFKPHNSVMSTVNYVDQMENVEPCENEEELLGSTELKPVKVEMKLDAEMPVSEETTDLQPSDAHLLKRCLGGFKTFLTYQAVDIVLFVETLNCNWLFDGELLHFRISVCL
ncbi:hypothetical protein QQ045_012372 [Rhodiola kirilowii]